MKPILEYRIKAFAIDYVIMAFVAFGVVALTDNIILASLIIYPLTMNKDFLNGKSIGKRIIGIQVQNLESEKASEWKGSFRNFLPIIPIDFLFALLSPERRIGDRIAGTKIGIEKEHSIKTIQTELKSYRINKELIFGILFGLINICGLLFFYLKLTFE